MNQYLFLALLILFLPLLGIGFDLLRKLFTKSTYHRLGLIYGKVRAYFLSFRKQKVVSARKDRFYGATRASKQFLKGFKQHFHPSNVKIGLTQSSYDFLYSNLLKAKGSYEDLYEHGQKLLANTEIQNQYSADEFETIKRYYDENLSRK